MKAQKSVAATEFKARRLALLEEVRQTRQPLLVTRHGKPVAEISPYMPKSQGEMNPLKGSVLHEGDVLSLSTRSGTVHRDRLGYAYLAVVCD